MRKAGQLVAEAHSVASSLIRPGVTTGEIDAAVELLFNEHGAIPLFKNFPGEVPFPAVTCTSVNEQIVHGIPGDVELQAGDILSIDTGCNLNGWCGDSAWTYPVGEVDGSSQKLMDAGIEILRTAVAELRTAKRWSEVALAMMAVAKDRGVSLVEQFVGHGIGRSMHEAPQVPNYFRPNMKFEDFEIQPGLVLAIEPMVNAGKKGVRILKDKWTAVTIDGKRSVHFEHTIAIGPDGPELLTKGVGTPFDF